MFAASSSQHEKASRDVIVVGYGSAGAAAAIEAAEAGAKVLLVEKMQHFGGNSVLSAGYMRVATDAAGAAAYLDACSGGRIDQPVIEALAQGMTEVIPYLQRLARPLNAKVFLNVGEDQGDDNVADLYDWPGRQSFGMAGIESVPEFTGYPWLHFGGRGQYLLRVLEANIEALNVEVWFHAPAKRLIVEEGRVLGLVVEREGREIQVYARGGVILACGGFEFNRRMLQDFLELPLIHSIGCPGNTGDGILMARQAGAALWHMWHIHGSYGFKFPEFPMAIRNHLGGARRARRKVAWILVDKKGKRFTNEVPPAPQDTAARPLAHLDAETGESDRIPAWMVFDDQGRRLGPIGKPIAAVPEHYYEWSADNSQEIERGWILTASTLEELAEKTRLPRSSFTATVARWNAAVNAGDDADFDRPAGTLAPVVSPPYYAVQVWPVCTNTQGGPRHDEFQRVLDAFGQPIPSLYAVGELGSFFGHIYMLGGNLAECLVGGRIAGRRAAQGLDRHARDTNLELENDPAEVS